MLATSAKLASAFDLAVLDLDGVVYVGDHAVDHAAESLEAAAKSMHLAFVTNNAARTTNAVAAHLTDLGVAAAPADVVTSAQAAARLLANRLSAGAPVFVIGTTGLFVALEEAGLRPVTTRTDEPVAVVQGYGPDMPWSRVVEGATLIADGLPWVASNTDTTIPTSAGLGPGNGALVELLERFAGRSPDVAGKPHRPLFEETLLRVGGERPLVIGDRLDTDIAGARAMSWPSLLVMTGVTGIAELAAARPEERPSFIGSDLRSLGAPHAAPTRSTRGWALGGWSGRVDDGELVAEGDGSLDDWWRCVACAAWEYLDETGAVVGLARVEDRLAP